MSNAEAVSILTQLLDVMTRMRDMTPKGELTPAQRAAINRAYNEEVVPLTQSVKKLLDDG